MPRGDKPTTTALALKDGWIYEDALPATITKEQYDWWYEESLALDGVRMGPPLPSDLPLQSEKLELPDRVWMRVDVLTSPELMEHFARLNPDDVEYVRAPVPPEQKRHEFLRFPLGRFRNSKDDIGKCWHVVNMLYCGLPADAEVHQQHEKQPKRSIHCLRTVLHRMRILGTLLQFRN